MASKRRTSVDGTSLESLGGIEQEWQGAYGPTTSVAFPDLVAPTWPDVEGHRVPGIFQVGLLLHAATVQGFDDMLAAYIALIDTPGPAVIGRTITLTGGEQTKTARGVFLTGLDPTMKSHSAGIITPRWQLLDAYFA